MNKFFYKLDDVIKYIHTILPDGGIVLLIGNLASGKTTLVQHFVKGLQLEDVALSPTFSILNIYDDRVYHYDIYNEGSDKFLESGLLENLELDGYHFIEWADEKIESLIKMLDLKYLKIEIKVDRQIREYKVSYGA